MNVLKFPWSTISEVETEHRPAFVPMVAEGLTASQLSGFLSEAVTIRDYTQAQVQGLIAQMIANSYGVSENALIYDTEHGDHITVSRSETVVQGNFLSEGSQDDVHTWLVVPTYSISFKVHYQDGEDTLQATDEFMAVIITGVSSSWFSGADPIGEVDNENLIFGRGMDLNDLFALWTPITGSGPTLNGVMPTDVNVYEPTQMQYQNFLLKQAAEVDLGYTQWPSVLVRESNNPIFMSKGVPLDYYSKGVFDSLGLVLNRQELELRYLARIMLVTLTTLTKNVELTKEQLDSLQQLSDEEFNVALSTGELSDLSSLATTNQMQMIQASLQLLLQNALNRDSDRFAAVLERLDRQIGAQRRESPVQTLATIAGLLK